MKSTTARTVLSLLGLTTWLATPVSAYFYCKFPSKITCPDGTVIQQHELEKVARRAKEGTIYEESASNLASGLCATIDLPYYVQDVGRGGVAIGVAYAWDSSGPGFYYCLHTDADFAAPCIEEHDPDVGQSENYCPQVIEN
ncbi:hypothetical protein GTA08_BOTSDO05403 [Botryosphaeria dothidea]|uniref:Uncharacterized protein n=1 Tax=Botryosphaeria dothidea TaxID=55169 RepID=A0A8H4ISX9_9PEZI|nr:hypothetical protein GTA08_BOTSDO05403 [Botryosphaeria dothidea]